MNNSNNTTTLRGVIGIIEKDGKYLFGLESKTGPLNNKWRLLGGKLESGESSEQALYRELREEAGIEIAIDGFLKTADGTHRDILIDVYHGRWISGNLNPKLDENSRIDWFSISELASLDVEELSGQAIYDYTLMKIRNERENANASGNRAKSESYFGPYMGCDAGAIG